MQSQSTYRRMQPPFTRTCKVRRTARAHSPVFAPCLRTQPGHPHAQRLAAEICQVVSAHPTLTELSCVGHSMGGLLLRHALGQLYDVTTGRICGLLPIAYVSLATPHLGLTRDETHAQVGMKVGAGA